MTKFGNPVIGLITLILVRSSLQSECGKKIGKGAVVCALGEGKNYQNFEFDKCTHAALRVSIFCGSSGDFCLPKIPADYNEVYSLVRPHFPTTLGIYIDISAVVETNLSNRLKRLKTAQTFVNFMSDQGFSFVIFTEKTWEADFNNSENRSALVLIEEFAKVVHNRGWHVGMSLSTGRSELATKYDLIKLSEFVDWFYLNPLRLPLLGQDNLEAYLPLTSPNNTEPGTAEYWFKHVLQWLKPECLVLGIVRFGLKYRTLEFAVEPGINSPAEFLQDPSVVGNSEICYKIALNSNCREHWDEESSTPWAICGDEFYTYDNPTSVGLKVNLAKQYNLSGVIFWNTESEPEEDCSENEKKMLLRSLQGIRNTTKSNTIVNSTPIPA